MNDTTAPIAPTPVHTRQPREILHIVCMIVVAVGFVIMALPEVLADVRYARSGVAVLTAIALIGVYFTGKKKE